MIPIPFPPALWMGSSGAPPPAPEDGPSPGVEPEKGLRGRLLVVEDDYFVGLTIENALVDAGHEVVAVAATGEQAIAAVAQRPELALMDIRLAGEMDGIEAATELRRRGIPSLFATAHSDPETRRRGEAARPAGWITKPFSNSELVAAVEAALVRLRGN